MSDLQKLSTAVDEAPDAIKRMRLYQGLDGIPFRLKPGQILPNLKTDDAEELKPQPVADAHVKVFNLSSADDLKEYAAIWDMASKGRAVISAEERHWSDKEQNFLVFLRWGEIFLELSKEAERAHRVFN